MKRCLLILCIFSVAVSGCAVFKRGGEPCVKTLYLRRLNAELEEAESIWLEAIDDPWIGPELKRRYAMMQDVCRECSRRSGEFATIEEKELCDRVQFPFVIYFNELNVQVNRLNEQIFDIDGEGTVASEYKNRPSRTNLEKLRNVFRQVHRYFVGWPYTWTRYINKYKFQKSRQEHFAREFRERYREYLTLAASDDAPPGTLKLARRRAEFSFHRLKKEYATNDLPPAGEVNAFYRARDLDDYRFILEEELEIAEKREGEGRRKEVAVFVHGLSEGRDAWGKFPEMLAREDLVNDRLRDVYFKVYVFSFDTVEDSKSVEGFKKELAGFISDIMRDEDVDGVHLIGHSFGSVLCGKYLTHQKDELLRGVNRQDTEKVAETLVKAYEEGKIPGTVKSIISIAGSLHGSHAANIAGDQFIPKEQLFRRRLPLLQVGVPGYGDIQVRENQIGSAVNLLAARRFDTECPLDPSGLVKFLPSVSCAAAEDLREKLRPLRIPVLCIIGDPCKFNCFFQKAGLLKIRETWKILTSEGLVSVVSSFNRMEDDGLVKSYGANLNHRYLLGSGEDIGYKDADVRYAAYAHFSLCDVDSRDHPSYRYVVSFLNGDLIPQIDREGYSIRQFAVLLRVFPEGVDPQDNPEAGLVPKKRKIIFLDDRKLDLPALQLKVLPSPDEEGSPGSTNVSVGTTKLNHITGVQFLEGRIRDAARPAQVAFEVNAEGYHGKTVTVPVSPGEVSYAVSIVLEEEDKE